MGCWVLHRCRECGLAITWPRPAPQELAALYDGAYYSERGMGMVAAEAWNSRADELVGLLPRGAASVLDWGAGLGHLVAALRRRGLDAEGVEPSGAAREAARQLGGVQLLEQVPRGRKFDAVSLYHSLEHVDDPRTVLIGLRESLAAQGMLFIEVPHVVSADMLLPRWRQQILSLPYHLLHFTPGSLRRLLEVSGYKVRSVNLINSRWVEVPLAWRARLARRPIPGGPSVVGGQELPRPVSWARHSWRGRVLPWLRRALPGWRFQVLAQHADARSD